MHLVSPVVCFIHFDIHIIHIILYTCSLHYLNLHFLLDCNPRRDEFDCLYRLHYVVARRNNKSPNRHSFSKLFLSGSLRPSVHLPGRIFVKKKKHCDTKQTAKRRSCRCCCRCCLLLCGCNADCSFSCHT